MPRGQPPLPPRSPDTRQDTAILIHISAPSGFHDDARYRAQARAYLESEGWRRTYSFPVGRDPNAGSIGVTSPARGRGHGVRYPSPQDRTPKPNETTESPKTPPTVQVHDSGGLASKRGQPLDTLSQSRARKRPSRLRIPLSQDDAAMTTDKNGDESPPSPSPARATRVLVPSTPPLHPLALFPPTPHSKRDLTILPPTYLPVLESLPPHVHFRPLLLQRPLAPLERGHWRLPTRDFPPALLTRFWTFLGHWIVGGRGGWGVWAVVETCHSALSAIARVEMRREVEYVKLYTFGGTVPQTWSLLVLATERWCKKAEAGAEWVDGEGRVVVKMS